MEPVIYRPDFSALDFLALANRVPELFVDPAFQRRGIGRELMRRAVDAAPRGALFFGAQPQSVGFFERIGCTRGPVGFVLRRADLGELPQRG